jgi:Protein of unknown function (DUF3617)
MRRVARYSLALTVSLMAFLVAAATSATDLPALVSPLRDDLQMPEYFESRCMLAPLFATDKRFIAMSRDESFRHGDRLLAINGEPLNPTSERAAHDLLVRYSPDATVTVRVLRAETEVDVTAPCTDSKEYFALLRAAVTAATQDDAATCADRLREAGKLHALASMWLNVSLNCESKAGGITGAPVLAEYFVIYHELLMENDYSPGALQKVRPALQGAAQKLLSAGSRPLAEKLQQEYAGEIAKWSPLQGSALALQLQPSAATPQTGIVSEPPRVAVAQNGKVTNLTVPGQLAAKNPVGCVPLNQIDNSRTPPDLYLGVSDCIQKDDYHAAAALFALAGIESRFDAARVLDRSAGQAGQVLIMNTFNGMPQDRRDKFGKTVGELAADPRAMAATCSAISKIGHPNYYPEYMVLHGISAFTAKSGDATMEPNFDAQTTWHSLLTTYLNCTGVPMPPKSTSPPASNAPVPASDPTRMQPGFYQVKTNGAILDSNPKPGETAVMRMCLTQAMLDKANPLNGQVGCTPKVTHDGNKTRTEVNCAKDGNTIAGISLETVNANTRSVTADVTTSGTVGSHSLHLEAEFTFLGTDCNTPEMPPAP